MFYKDELNFFRNVIEKSKIQTVIITKTEMPKKIDMGIRDYLNLKSDYEELFNKFGNEKTIIKVCDPFFCNYIFIPLPQCEIESVLVVGPYTKNAVAKKDISKVTHEYAFSQKITAEIQKYFSTVPYLNDDGMIMTLVNCLGEKLFGSLDGFTVLAKDIREISDISLIYKSDTAEKSDDPWLTVQMLERRYNAENELLSAVSQGLVHKAEMVFANIKPSESLEPRIADPLRNAKNFMIITNTLLRKAAEQGSVHPLYIDGISSDFAKKIESLQTLSEADELFAYMVKKYCRLVNKHSQKKYSLLIQKVITRIDADISADLSLKTQADFLNVNPSYLSTLFKKETGKTLTEFVKIKRTEKAKHLLISTNMQIQNIAQNCGILDVNYFTKIFKKYTDKTPNEYRKSFNI